MAVVGSVLDVSPVIINLTPSYIAGTESSVSMILSSSKFSVHVFFKLVTCQVCVVITLLKVISIEESTCMLCHFQKAA